jgi:hypothetical protein
VCGLSKVTTTLEALVSHRDARTTFEGRPLMDELGRRIGSAPGVTRIIADISVSLDGFVTGPHPGPDNGLGNGGEALHTWAFSDDPDDRRVLREATARSGAVVLGRRLFDVVDGPGGWDDETGYGAGEVGKPAFVS